MNATAGWTAAIALLLLSSGALYFRRLDEVPVYVSTDEAKLAETSQPTRAAILKGTELSVFGEKPARVSDRAC